MISRLFILIFRAASARKNIFKGNMKICKTLPESLDFLFKKQKSQISMKIGLDHTKMKLRTSGIQFSPPKSPKYPKIDPK